MNFVNYLICFISKLVYDSLQVSKHRGVMPEPDTPEHYWEVGMPDREEQRRRGQIAESDSPIAAKTRYPHYEIKKPVRRRLFT